MEVTTANMSVLLDVQELQTRFKVRKGYVYAVNGVSFQLEEGETLAVVGESGCGKSVTMLSLVRLLPPAASIENGQVLLREKTCCRSTCVSCVTCGAARSA